MRDIAYEQAVITQRRYAILENIILEWRQALAVLPKNTAPP
jgi:hypothetical protein